MDRDKELSLKLYEVLDNIGLSAEMRSIREEVATTTEILETLFVPSQHSLYLFGSQSECSTIPAMDSDSDVVWVPTNMPLVTDVIDCQDSDSFLLVPDSYPGYAKLQLLRQGRPITIPNDDPMPRMVQPNFMFQCDKGNRVCLTRNWPQACEDETHRQGPAMNYHANENLASVDHIYALECKTWPECASEWLTRERVHGWPSPNLIEECKSMGFLVVQAGHPDCDDSHIQWRISFSRQELLFMREFNVVQMKCYVLLKVIKKEFIQKYIKEETLTSYHCKTCMFYCIEKSTTDFWVPENLAYCLLMCLKQLMSWVSSDNCPNYFIPGENMFDRIRSESLKKQLLDNLGTIVSHYVKHIRDLLHFLLSNHRHRTYLSGSLKSCDSLLRKKMESPQTLNEELDNITTNKKAFLKQYRTVLYNINSTIGIVYTVMVGRNILLYNCFEGKSEPFIGKLQSKVTELEQTTRVTHHTEKQSKDAISLILPFLQLNLLSLRAARTLEERLGQLREVLFDVKWTELDLVNGSLKLKQACALLMLGYTDKSMGLLLSVIQKGQPDKHPLCGCYVHLSQPDTPPVSDVTIERQGIVIKKLLHDFYQPCVVYLPHEYRITPLAVNYEMIRAYGRSPRSAKDSLLVFCCDWGVVDGIFLTQFLLYLNHKALGQASLATNTVRKMIRICNKKNPCHLDTSLNLLGWVIKDRGDYDRAAECFQRSVELQPTYNAACWHLCFLICGY